MGFPNIVTLYARNARTPSFESGMVGVGEGGPEFPRVQP